MNRPDSQSLNFILVWQSKLRLSLGEPATSCPWDADLLFSVLRRTCGNLALQAFDQRVGCCRRGAKTKWLYATKLAGNHVGSIWCPGGSIGMSGAVSILPRHDAWLHLYPTRHPLCRRGVLRRIIEGRESMRICLRPRRASGVASRYVAARGRDNRHTPPCRFALTSPRKFAL